MAGKKVIKAHRGFAHVPMRGRGRPPMRPPVRDPRRPQRDPRRPQRDPRMPQLPRQLPRNFNQMSPRARMQFMMERDLMRRQRQDLPSRRQISRRRAEDMARRRLDQAMRRRTRRRPTGTPVPQQRISDDQRGSITNPIPAPATSYPAQEVRQARPEPMERPTGRRVAAKGKFITKKNIGANDYRQGGMVLNSVDNRKNKK